MAAQEFFLPFPTAFNSNGAPAPGAKIQFYVTETSTPAAIYTTSALTTEHPNPVEANGAGMFPNIFLDDAVTYRVVITDSEGNSLGVDQDPYIPGVSSAVISIGTTSEVSTISAMEAIASPSNRDTCYLTEAKKEGKFVFSNDDLSAEVTNDSEQGIYIAPSSDATGASGAWVRVVDGWANVLWFGANDAFNNGANSGADSTAAFQGACDSGYPVWVPRGVYVIRGRVRRTHGVTIQGASDADIGGTIIYAGGSTEAFLSGPDTLGDGYDAQDYAGFVALSTMCLRTTSDFTGNAIVRDTVTFQTYYERINIKRIQNRPTKALFEFDNLQTTEAPVRVVMRDVRIDGAGYDSANGDGNRLECAIWNKGGIQLCIDNTHIEECNVGCRLGVDPTDPDYSADDTESADVYFINNSRFQSGSLGNQNSECCAFEVWEGGNLRISDSTFYLNNYGAANTPDPATPGMTVIRVKDSSGSGGFEKFRDISFTNNLVSGTARTDHFFVVESGAEVETLYVDHNTFVGTQANDSVYDIQGTCGLIDGDNAYENNNTHNDYHEIGNFTSGVAINLDQGRNLLATVTDGGTRTINSFSGGRRGIVYQLRIRLQNSSVVKIQTSASGTTTGGIVGCGTPGSVLSLQDGDIIQIRRGAERTNDPYFITVHSSKALPATTFSGGAASSGRETVVKIVQGPTDSNGLLLGGTVGSSVKHILNGFNAQLEMGVNDVPFFYLNTDGTIELDAATLPAAGAANDGKLIVDTATGELKFGKSSAWVTVA